MTAASFKAAFDRWFTNPGLQRVLCQQARYLGIDCKSECGRFA